MKILSPATSANLGPGFDSLGLAIKLYNEITITEQSFSQISISGEGKNNSILKKNNSFVNIFNSYLWPLLVTNTPKMRTIQVGITMLGFSESLNYGPTIAAIILLFIPFALLFVIFKKSIMKALEKRYLYS